MNESPPVKNCRFSVLCLLTWEDLDEIKGHPTIKYCQQCDQSVHLCSRDDFYEHAKQGHCVALIPHEDEEKEEPVRRKLLGLIDFDSLKPDA